MRFPAAVSLLALAASCTPVREPQPAPPVHAAGERKNLPAPPPARTLESPGATTGNFSGITFEGVTFDSRSHHLVVADQAGGPGSLFPDATSAASSRGGIAAVNAGFFTPEGTPLGLVVSGGKPSGTWNSASSLGGGVFHEDPTGKMAVTRRETLGRQAAAAMSELIQAGPMLVENHRVVGGLDAAKTSARTLIAWDGGDRWWLGRTGPCSLASLAAALASQPPGGWPVRHALNLDGGRSSDLWISAAVSGGPLSRRPPWNRPVRNFLILTAR
jgi:hypothetical protein